MVWDEIIHPFPNVSGCTVEVCELSSNFIPLYNGCNYLYMLGLKLNHVSKTSPRRASTPPISFYSVWLSVSVSVSASVCLSVRPSIRVSVSVSLCLCLCLSVCLSVCLSPFSPTSLSLAVPSRHLALPPSLSHTQHTHAQHTHTRTHASKHISTATVWWQTN